MPAQSVQYRSNNAFHAYKVEDVSAAQQDPNADLWNAVIVLAIEDARRRKDGHPTPESARARAWLFDAANEEDFRQICDLARLEYSWVRDVAKRFIALPQLPLARTLNGAKQ